MWPRAQAAVASGLTLPQGYTLTWTGQYEFQVRARERLRILLPVVLALILLLLYLTFHSFVGGRDRDAVGASTR